jgi:drug/metabolite transporter (DMT)-like permease
VATTPLFTLFLTPVVLGDREKITWRIALGSVLIVVGVIFVTAL